MNIKFLFTFIIYSLLSVNFLYSNSKIRYNKVRSLVDYVNPYIGGISHLLVPTFPTVYLPNSMMRVHPLRDDVTGNKLHGLPILLVGHRSDHVFTISPYQGTDFSKKYVVNYEYDNEVVKPYFYSVYLDNVTTEVKFAPSHQSAIYELDYKGTNEPSLIISSENGQISYNRNIVTGWQHVGNTSTKAYIYLETEEMPQKAETFRENVYDQENRTEGVIKDGIVFYFNKKGNRKIRVRYGVSFISVEQAKRNLYREIVSYDLESVIKAGRNIWNKSLEKIKVVGDSEDEKTVFYTSLYRVYERMICLSEDGRYFSGFDGKIHDDNGIPFYNDDWLWDTYRAAHPLRVIIDPEKENFMINSFIRMATQTENFWMPTFPEITGDSRRMNSNHGVATIIDGYEKGLRNFDLEKAYLACKNAITGKTLAPWSDKKSGKLDDFFKEKGYFPALANGEQETIPEIDSWEKRQPVAVTLGTVYDEWCLSRIAQHLGKKDEADYFLKRSLNYRELFNQETKFFHPKNKNGEFITPFDYRYSGGLGARDAYDENNGWIYRWDVQHNISDLVEMMGGKDIFVLELEKMYDTPLGKPKYEFYASLPDHTGNVGQFSMANEPSLHVPYLYNYAGCPWRTQKKIRELLEQWFRNDLMGLPGDEDGGAMSAFVVFSALGFYPVTPGLPIYVIGSPIFKNVKIKLDKGKVFEIKCHNYSVENKYIQSARLNGEELKKSWFHHNDMVNDGKLEFYMGKYPNKQWASDSEATPPSFKMNNNSSNN